MNQKLVSCDMMHIFAVRKATQKDQRDFTKRKLSIHVELPDDAQPLDTSEVSVPEASSGETMMLSMLIDLVLM